MSFCREYTPCIPPLLKLDNFRINKKKGENMFKVEKCYPEAKLEIKYPFTHATIKQEMEINGKWSLYIGEGQATCNMEDKFNKDFGFELAKTRAKIAMLKNYESKLILLTKEPGWRKKKEFWSGSLITEYDICAHTKEFKLCDIDGKVLKTITVTEE